VGEAGGEAVLVGFKLEEGDLEQENKRKEKEKGKRKERR